MRIDNIATPAPQSSKTTSPQTVEKTLQDPLKKEFKVPEGTIHHKGPMRPPGDSMTERELRQKIMSKHLDNGMPMPKPKSNRPRFPLDDAPLESKKMALDNPEKIMSDVGLNDPNDPTTTEKLKSVLGSGAVQFNERERGVLEKILK